MSLKVERALRRIEHALGNRPLSKHLNGLEALNEAGRAFFGLRGWTFLQRPAASLSLVAGQSYLVLPEDWDSAVLKPEIVSNTTRRFRWESMQEVMLQRATGYTDGDWVGCIAFAQGPPLVPQIELAPVPLTSDANAFSVFYRAVWVDQLHDDDFIPLPDAGPVQTAFLAYLEAYVQELDDDAVGLVERVMGSAEMEAAIAWDARQQPSLGKMKGGVGRQMTRGYTEGRYAGP